MAAVEAHDVRPGHREELGDLLCHLSEYAAGRLSAGDKRRHSAQRRLLVRKRTLGRLACRKSFSRTRALGGLRSEYQRCERRDGDEKLRREQAVADRVAQERPVVLRGVPNRDRTDDENSGGRSARSEADRSPQQDRKDDVGHIALWCQLRQRHEREEQNRAFPELSPMEAPETRGRPGEDQRCDDEHAARVAQHPGAKHPPQLICRDHIARPQGQRPERRTDQSRDQRAGEEGEYVSDTVQAAAPSGEAAQKQGRGDERESVPERLGEHRPQGRRVVAEHQVADHDRRPQACAIEEQHGEAETGRRPQRRHRAVEVGQLEADAAGAVVREAHERDRERIEQRPLVPLAAKGSDPVTQRYATGARCARLTCRHGLPAESALGTAGDRHGTLPGAANHRDLRFNISTP